MDTNRKAHFTQQYSDSELASQMQLEEVLEVTAKLAKVPAGGGFELGKFYDDDVRPRVPPGPDELYPGLSNFAGFPYQVPPYYDCGPVLPLVSPGGAYHFACDLELDFSSVNSKNLKSVETNLVSQKQLQFLRTTKASPLFLPFLTSLQKSEWETGEECLYDPSLFPLHVPINGDARYSLRGKAPKFDGDMHPNKDFAYEVEYESLAGKTCNICLVTEISSNNSHIVSDKCNHRFCTDCLRQHGETTMKSGKSSVPCPEYKCTESWSQQLCQLLLSPVALKQMVRRQVEKAISDWERIYCPYKDCSAVQLRPDLPATSGHSGSQKTAVGGVECLACHRLFCLECQVPWHSHLTCQEYEKLPEDKRSDLLLLRGLAKEKKWQRCSCGYVVERNKGCVHMKCRCGKEFCYICGGKWSHHHLCKI